jgi:hypothetical protein
MTFIWHGCRGTNHHQRRDGRGWFFVIVDEHGHKVDEVPIANV